MIKVELLSGPTMDPEELARFAARTCYAGTLPKSGKGERPDVQTSLFETGHHTTLEHASYTFSIEGIAIGDVDFGLHLASPFYNTDQRSGRFCAEMFANPNYEQIEKYLEMWPDVTEETRAKILDYVKSGIDIYNSYMAEATLRAERYIREDRPKADDEYVEKNGEKFAQEQLRVFIPVIFPTGMVFTVNEVTLEALHAAAWSPGMREVTGQMAELLTDTYKIPRERFVRSIKLDWAPELETKGLEQARILEKPVATLVRIDAWPWGVRSVNQEDTHPIDLLRANPRYMTLSTASLHYAIAISLATMGQDQRHRTVRRSKPAFTGAFYLPPLAVDLGMKKLAENHMAIWLSLQNLLPPTLGAILAPYGAMVAYEKEADFDAAMHELEKRTCWCAQEEIYHLAVALRQDISKSVPSHRILSSLAPRCYGGDRACGEGNRYCGRIIGEQKKGEEAYFPNRRI